MPAKKPPAKAPATKSVRGQVEEVPKPVLVQGAGWTPENLACLRAVAVEERQALLWQIFDWPSGKHPILDVVAEYYLNAFTVAQQISDPGRSMVAMLIFSDYLTAIQSCSGGEEAFAVWTQRAMKGLAAAEFPQAEQALLLSYMNRVLRDRCNTFRFVLVEDLKNSDPDGFRAACAVQQRDTGDEEGVEEKDPAAELEAQLAAAALAEKRAEEEARKRAEAQTLAEQLVNETFTRIQAAMDARTEALVMQLQELQAQLDGKPKRG